MPNTTKRRGAPSVERAGSQGRAHANPSRSVRHRGGLVARKPKTIELALQGGGSHGAFTWGVLDRLLEDDRIVVGSISGTSAGAMNGAVVADGLDRGGKEAAREALNHFWEGVSEAARFSPFQRTPLNWLLGRWDLDDSPGYHLVEMLSRALSPYALNPMNLNPLRDMIDSLVDFKHVRHAKGIKLFVSAINVRTGKPRVFHRQELTADMVMASACLPQAFQAVEIDGEAYWDGGYIGNPALAPLVEDSQSRDLVIVQINPIFREELPRDAIDIHNRINEITFNAALVKELRAIAYLKRLIRVQKLERKLYMDVFFHRINADPELKPLGASSKMNGEWAFLRHLHDVGYRTTSAWLDNNFDALGHHSTLDVENVYF
ncbi:MAG: patatin [Phycisphaerales bacterium]|nr:patatin [Phycisphaerales bacterium]